jgi:hypothetical protein
MRGLICELCGRPLVPGDIYETCPRCGRLVAPCCQTGKADMICKCCVFDVVEDRGVWTNET